MSDFSDRAEKVKAGIEALLESKGVRISQLEQEAAEAVKALEDLETLISKSDPAPAVSEESAPDDAPADSYVTEVQPELVPEQPQV
jgi:hypothetical protein